MGEELDLSAIERRAEAVTEGPWCVDECYAEGGPPLGIFHQAAVDEFYNVFRAVERSMTIENAQFIAHTRGDVPALVAEVRRLLDREEELEQCVAELNAWDAPVELQKSRTEIRRLREYLKCGDELQTALENSNGDLRVVIFGALQVLETCEIRPGSIVHDELREVFIGEDVPVPFCSECADKDVEIVALSKALCDGNDGLLRHSDEIERLEKENTRLL